MKQYSLRKHWWSCNRAPHFLQLTSQLKPCLHSCIVLFALPVRLQQKQKLKRKRCLCVVSVCTKNGFKSRARTSKKTAGVEVLFWLMASVGKCPQVPWNLLGISRLKRLVSTSTSSLSAWRDTMHWSFTRLVLLWDVGIPEDQGAELHFAIEKHGKYSNNLG